MLCVLVNLCDKFANRCFQQEQAKLDAAFTLQWGGDAKDQFGAIMDQLSRRFISCDSFPNNQRNYRSAFYRRQIESIQVLGTANLEDSKQDEVEHSW